MVNFLTRMARIFTNFLIIRVICVIRVRFFPRPREILKNPILLVRFQVYKNLISGVLADGDRFGGVCKLDGDGLGDGGVGNGR